MRALFRVAVKNGVLFFRKALLPRRWEALRKNVSFVLAHSLSSTKLMCLSCPGLAWKYPNINYITLHYIRPLFIVDYLVVKHVSLHGLTFGLYVLMYEFVISVNRLHV